MANIVQYLASLFRAGEKKRRTVRRTTDERTPKVYKTNTTNEDVYKIMNISRLPLEQQRDYYTKVEPELGEKVVKDTQKAFEDNPFQAGFMEAFAPVSALETVKQATGKDIDVSKAKETTAYKVGQIAGLVGQFATTGGIAQDAVTVGLLKGVGATAIKTGTKATAKQVAQKFVAQRGSDVLTGIPLNIAETLKQGGTTEDKLKNFGVNTAVDLATGTVIGTLSPSVSKYIKSLKAKDVAKEGTEAFVKSGDIPAESTDVVENAVKTIQERATNRKLKEGTTPVQEFKGEIPTAPIKVEEPKPIEVEIDELTTPKPTGKKERPKPAPEVLQKMPEESRKNFLRRIVDEVRLRGVDTFTPQEDYARSLLNTNPELGEKLLAKINKSRNATQQVYNWITYRQVDASGIKDLGKPLTEIKSMIPENKVGAFQDFMFMRHHLDRLKQGKPIFATNREETIAKIQEIFSTLTDAEKKMFNDADMEIRNYIKNLRQYAQDTGLLTKKQIDLFEELYPNYIKTVRASGDDFIGVGSGSSKVRDIYKAASRGNDPILPLWNQLEILTRDTITTGNINDLMRELYTARFGAMKGVKEKAKDIADNMFAPPELSVVDGKDAIKFYNNGKVVSMPVSPLEAKSFKILTGGGIMSSDVAQALMKYVNPLNRWFKLPITGVNPIFLVKNGLRDSADALFYSKDPMGFISKYPQAAQELANKGEYYRLWQSSGGRYSSYFNLDANLRDKRTWFTKTVSERIENANALVESLPRMAEFINIIEKELNGKPLSELTEDILNKAVYGAAEITTNFGRGGDIGKLLNSTVVPFFNPSIQGTSRLIRRLTMQDGFRGFMPLIMKAAVLGVAPAVLNEMVYGDNEEYQMLPDRYKLTNYVFKIGDKWIRIPRGRVLSVLGMIPQALVGELKGDEYDFAEMVSVAGGQVAPVNPFESNLFSPIVGAATNTTWYGGPIDGKEWDKIKTSDHYDSKTSEIGKLLGSIEFMPGKNNINFSPKQWDYIINSYTGIFGDVILPLSTGKKDVGERLKAGAEAFPNAFTLDPTFQNDLSKEFYDLYDKYTIISKDPTVEEKLVKRFMERYRSKTSEIIKEIKDIQNSNLPDSVKESEIKELRDQLNNMYRNAEFEVNEFKSFLTDSVNKYGEEGGYTRSVINASIESGEDEWVAYTQFMDGNKKDNYEVAKNAGVSAADYYKLFDGRLDIDKSGGITQDEAQQVLDSMGFSDEQKGVLWGIINKGWKSNPYTGGSYKSSKASIVAKAYRDGLATKQVQALKDLNISTPTLSTAEVKAIIKMLSS